MCLNEFVSIYGLCRYDFDASAIRGQHINWPKNRLLIKIYFVYMAKVIFSDITTIPCDERTFWCLQGARLLRG